MKRWKHNAIQFDTASSGIFNQIKIHKNNNLSLPEIVKVIKKNLSFNLLASKPEKADKLIGQNIVNSLENNLMNKLLESEKARHNAELRVFHAEKNELENKLKRHENDIKLLTDGTTTDMRVFLKDRMKIDVERQLIINDIKNTRFWQFKKRRFLINKLENSMILK